MKMISVLMVRIYILEQSDLLNEIVNYLHNTVKIRGLSVFRAVSGFGSHGIHHASLVDLSLNLPLSIEFFDDDKDKVLNALDYASKLVKPEHIVMWEAKANA